MEVTTGAEENAAEDAVLMHLEAGRRGDLNCAFDWEDGMPLKTLRNAIRNGIMTISVTFLSEFVPHRADVGCRHSVGFGSKKRCIFYNFLETGIVRFREI